MFVAYIFEAKQLQSFIFETSKLRDASGASELVNLCAFETLSETDEPDSEPEDLLSKVLAEAGLGNDAITVHRRSGGVVSLVAEKGKLEQLTGFRILWRLSVVALAPGLVFTDGLAEGADSVQAMNLAYAAIRSAPPRSNMQVPFASPLVRMAPRTGRAPVPGGAGVTDGKCKITREFVDEPTRAKRQYLEQGNLTLPRLFAGSQASDYKWPLHFDGDEGRCDEVFPFSPSVPQRLAIIHIDGNDVGQMFQDAVGELTSGEVRERSRSLARATQNAAQVAMTKAVLPNAINKVVPARPVLIGGDDLTIILRADLALDFVIEYIGAFESKTQKAFSGASLQAKAGIVFLGVHQPFSQGYELCESLATTAKHPERSRMSFVRVTSAFIPRDAQEVRRNRQNLWREAWDLNAVKELRKLANLLEHEDIGRGALRRVANLLSLADPAQAKGVYRRALEVLEKRNPDVHVDLLEVLEGFGISADSPVNNEGFCPLLDAYDLGHIAQCTRGGE